MAYFFKNYGLIRKKMVVQQPKVKIFCGQTFHIKNFKLLKDHPGNESRKGSKAWAGPLTYRYQYIYLVFLNRQNGDFRTPNKYLPRPILLTALPNSEFFKICRIISYWVTFNIYLLDYVPIKVIWSNIFFQFLTFYLGHFIANYPYIYKRVYIIIKSDLLTFPQQNMLCIFPLCWSGTYSCQ